MPRPQLSKQIKQMRCLLYPEMNNIYCPHMYQKFYYGIMYNELITDQKIELYKSKRKKVISIEEECKELLSKERINKKPKIHLKRPFVAIVKKEKVEYVNYEKDNNSITINFL